MARSPIKTARAARGARRRGSKRPGPGSGKRRRWRWRFKLALVAVAAALTAVVYMDLQVRRAFIGRPWSRASQIYSDALVLYPGQVMRQADLEDELAARGYRQVSSHRPAPGEYGKRGATTTLHLRSFAYPEGEVAGFPATLRLAGGRIAALQMGDGRDLEMLVLEPRVLGAFYGDQQEAREWVALQGTPEHLRRAVVMVEDRRFFRHMGLDARGLGRAMWRNLRAGGIVEGGSTITQQVVKNVVVGHERSAWRKLREMVMAPLLEWHLGKDEILEIYLNAIYLGQKGPVSIAGVGEASRFYFGRRVEDLDLGQAALLAGLIRSPGTYNPWAHPERARQRRDEVLRLMAAGGAISVAEAKAAGHRALGLADATGGPLPEAASYLDFLKTRLLEQYGEERLRRHGLRIFTTVDTRLQSAAARALSQGLERLEERQPRLAGRLQGALVVMHPRTGAVLAMVGGRDFAASGFNRALQARRQVGSLFKPFVYLAAFEAAAAGLPGGLTPASRLEDEPLSLQSGGKLWQPANSDGRFRGLVSPRQALAQSINIPAVRAAQGVGVERVATMASRCGFPPDLPRVPSLALGAAVASPLEVAVAFSTLAAAGRRPRPRAVKNITDSSGTSLWSQAAESTQEVSPEAAYLVVDMLREAASTGTARGVAAAHLRGEVAAKTGTTNGGRDAWFVGFTPDFLAVVWVGADDNRPLGLGGAGTAMPIWLDLVRRVGADSGRRFVQPGGIVHAWIDPDSGGLARRGCPRQEREIFIWGTEPDDCPVHGAPGFWGRLFRR